MSTTQFDILKLLKRNQPPQPWDERLPNGVPALQAGMSQGGESQPPLTANPALQRVGVTVPNRDILSLLKSGQPPPPNEGPPDTSIPRVRVGTDTSQMDPMQRQQAKVDLLRNSSPTSKVSDRGNFIEEGPPEQSPSRVKNALLGLLLGTAQGGLAGGIGGAALGGIKPEAIQQLIRDKHIAREQGQLDQQLGIDAKQAQIEHQRAATDELKEGKRRYVERSDGVYEISPLFPEGRKLGAIPSEAKSSRAPVHYESREDGVYAIFDDGNGLKAQKVEGVPGKPSTPDAAADEGEALADSTQTASDELKATLDQQKAQLTTNEASIRQKEAAWRTEAQRRFDELHKKVTEKDSTGNDVTYDPHEDDKRTVKDFIEEVKAADADYQKGVYDTTIENTKRLRDAISEGDKRLSGMNEDVRRGRAKGARGGRGSSGVTLQGAIDAFKAKAGRDPTAEEIENIKKGYGLQ